MKRKYFISVIKWFFYSIPIITLVVVVLYVNVLYPIIHRGRFLNDFDFFVHHIQDSFPFIGVAERRHGIDFDIVIAEKRKVISIIYDEEDFLIVLREMNYLFNPIGHFTVLPAHSRHFIQSRDVSHRLGIPFIPHSFLPQQASASAVNFSTNVVEEGRIAIVTLYTLTLPGVAYTESEIAYLAEFFAEIQGYEHLIIDIRQTRGGLALAQTDLFIRPNITETLQFYNFGFYTDGQVAWYAVTNLWAEMPALAFRSGRLGFHLPAYGLVGEIHHIHDAHNLVDMYNLTYMNLDDLSNLTYGYKMTTFVTPETNSPFSFGGRIWVLTSAINISASELFARLSKHAGFTLVGETTPGATAYAGMVFFRLPRSRFIVMFDALYVTDHLGRSLEEYRVVPHYFNMYGKCALETTLALIAQGR